MKKAETGKTRDAKGTSDRILKAAKTAFAQVGYGEAGVRHIAARAGVDPAMITRYYGSKAGLFEAALIDAIADYPKLDLSRERFAERLGTMVAQTLMREQSLAMIVLSAGDPEAQAISLKVMQDHAIAPLADWLGPPDAEARAIRITMLSTGFIFYSRHLPLNSATSDQYDKTAAWLASTLESIISEG